MNDSAVAYTFFMIVVLLLLGTFIFILLVPMENQVTGILNDRIEDGDVSEQTAWYYGFSTTLFNSIAGFTLIGVLIYAVQRAIEKRNMG